MDILDPKNVLGSTGMLADQCKQIWEDVKKIEFPADYRNFQNILLCGMGGSSYGSYIIPALFKDKLKIPLILNNDYQLPAFVDNNTLIFLSSYSGSTEEVLACAEEAQKLGLKITGITIGEKLGDFFKNNGYPAVVYEPKFNPSSQPRLGTGYTIFGAIAILNQMRIIDVSEEEVSAALSELRNNQEIIKNEAKALVSKIKGYIPVIVAAEFLAGNAYIFRNQFNETAKSFAAFSPLPDLNHYLMEGLKNPTDKRLIGLFINSDLYSDKLKKRFRLTEDVVSKNGVEYVEYKPGGTTKLSQMLNVLSFGGFLTLYLAFNYGQDPSLIPWVDYFKEQLAKP